jgi:hypothetical protein
MPLTMIDEIENLNFRLSKILRLNDRNGEGVLSSFFCHNGGAISARPGCPVVLAVEVNEMAIERGLPRSCLQFTRSAGKAKRS